jgi:hypothetical protein
LLWVDEMLDHSPRPSVRYEILDVVPSVRHPGISRPEEPSRREPSVTGDQA